jgi:hypothetical protein
MSCEKCFRHAIAGKPVFRPLEAVALVGKHRVCPARLWVHAIEVSRTRSNEAPKSPGAAFCLNSRKTSSRRGVWPRTSPARSACCRPPVPPDIPETLRKRRRETGSRPQKDPAGTGRIRLTIVNAAPYVGRMTRAANEGRSLACQGLHNAPVLAYVLPRTVLLTVPCRRF